MSAHSRGKRRTTGSIAAATVALFAILLGTAAPASAQPPEPVARYVALGDSYAAGQGAASPLDDCLRSVAAYPVLLDAEPRTNLLRQASCSGATIDIVMATQLPQVNRGTTLVTVTAGGNDLAVGQIYAYCTTAGLEAQCLDAIEAAGAKLQSGEVGSDLGSLIAAIADRAPNARIVVTDYPLLFANGFSPITDIVNTYTGVLNAQIATAVATAGGQDIDVELASVVAAFAGSQYPIGDPALLGIDPGNTLAFLHPTAAGQQEYRDAILAALAD